MRFEMHPITFDAEMNTNGARAPAPPLETPSARPREQGLPHSPHPLHLPRLPAGAIDTWPVSFTGTDAAYARIWWRGLVLSVLSLGLYLPWARIASQRYLLQHTRVAGQSMDDRRAPWPMLVRQGLAMALLGGAAMAGWGSTAMGLLAATLALAVWPMLMLLSWTQRVQRTTWARRALDVDASLGDVYRVLGLPLAGVACLAWAWWGAASWGHPVAWVLWGMGLGAWLLGVPVWCWGWLHVRQSSLRLGPVRLRWRLGPGAFMAWLLQTLVHTVLAVALSVGLAAMGLAALLLLPAEHGRAWGGLPWALPALLCASVWLAMWLVWPQARARGHKLVWNRTGDRHVRVRCRLRVRAMVRMQRRHGLLLLLTLGLYWPWAVSQSRRMRLNATVLQSRVGVAVLAAHWPVK